MFLRLLLSYRTSMLLLQRRLEIRVLCHITPAHHRHSCPPRQTSLCAPSPSLPSSSFFFLPSSFILLHSFFILSVFFFLSFFLSSSSYIFPIPTRPSRSNCSATMWGRCTLRQRETRTTSRSAHNKKIRTDTARDESNTGLVVCVWRGVYTLLTCGDPTGTR